MQLQSMWENFAWIKELSAGVLPTPHQYECNKKCSEAVKLVATPLLFSCTSHCVLNLYVNAVYNIFISLRKYFFPQNTNFVYLHKTLAQFYHFIIHIHPIPHRDVHGILKLSPLSPANLSFFIIDHSFFTIFPLTFPHKSLIMLSKLII